MPTQADSRVGGMQIQPFSLQKQAAVRTGVANAIGVQASDVSLDILTVFGSQVSPSSCLCCALEMLNVCSLASLNMSPPTLSPSSCAAHLPVYRDLCVGFSQYTWERVGGGVCRVLQGGNCCSCQVSLELASFLGQGSRASQGHRCSQHMHTTYSKHAPMQPPNCSS